MAKGISSKEAIMGVCREIVAQKGLQELNMRTVAEECHIALGTLYNYFANKDELMLSTIESVWKDIFHMSQKCAVSESFPEYVSGIFECVQKGAEEYPNFFVTHSISMAGSKKSMAKNTMEQYFEHIRQAMRKSLSGDKAVDRSVFSDSLSEDDFIKFVFDHMIFLLESGKTDCDVLIEILRKILYR